MTPASFDFDVFISYSSKDKEWVRGELLKHIEQAGLKAFIDFRDFTRGAPSIREMERGVVECRKTLLILTPNYIASGWAELENIMVLTLDPANRDLRLIPLLKVECQKPLRLGTLTHIDFTDGADHDLAWRQLLTALGKPPEPPPEPQRDRWFLAHPYPAPPNFSKESRDPPSSPNGPAEVAQPLVFLSHNSADTEVVRELAKSLRGRGLRTWVDVENLPLGRIWQEEMDNATKAVDAALILVASNGIGPWEHVEVRIFLSQLVKRRLPVIPVLLPGAPGKPVDLPLFLQELTWADLRDGITPKDLDRIVAGVTGIPLQLKSTTGSAREAEDRSATNGFQQRGLKWFNLKRTAMMVAITATIMAIVILAPWVECLYTSAKVITAPKECRRLSEAKITVNAQKGDIRFVIGNVARQVGALPVTGKELAGIEVTLESKGARLGDFMDSLCRTNGCTWHFDSGKPCTLIVVRGCRKLPWPWSQFSLRSPFHSNQRAGVDGPASVFPDGYPAA